MTRIERVSAEPLEHELGGGGGSSQWRLTQVLSATGKGPRYRQ